MKKKNARKGAIPKRRVSGEKEVAPKELTVEESAAIQLKKENSRIAILNLLEDLNVEKSKAETVEAKEEAILLSIGESVVATDENERIVLINRTAEKLMNLKKEDALGKVFFDIIHLENDKGELIPYEKRPIHLALTHGTITVTSVGHTYYIVPKNKSKFPVAMTVTPVKLSGKVIGAIAIYRDITEEKEIDRSKSEFVSLASHQLRTPLTSVSWYTELLLSGDVGVTTPIQKKYLKEIYQGNKRMVNLVNTLLNVSRLDLGTLVVEAKPTDIAESARKVLDDQKLKVANKNLKVTTKFDDDPKVLIDPNQLGMVLQNLVANAFTYTPPGGKIELAVFLDNDKKHAIFRITDTGYGIPKKQKNKIFGKFFRADNVRAKDTEGTGLGLYIVKSIVEKSGGKIWFESEENKGSTFYVKLPLVQVNKPTADQFHEFKDKPISLIK